MPLDDLEYSADRSQSRPLLEAYVGVRQHSEALAAPLSPEDQQVQSMPDASPTKWHLAHTTWFFETFVLAPHLPGYEAFDPDFAYLFNSYYDALGPRPVRAERGAMTRPGLEQILAYRRHVDAAMQRLFAAPNGVAHEGLIRLGLNHEQQHQELILSDIKHLLSLNPLAPAYATQPDGVASVARPAAWIDFDGGLVEIGHEGEDFAFDNEGPRHRVWIEPFRLADRLVTCGEWQAFIDDGGYRRPELWLSDGWATVQSERWVAPLYWRQVNRVFTLYGEQSIDDEAPVVHISAYEADAFARWSGRRLPTEAEWEVAARSTMALGAPSSFEPSPADDRPGLRQMTGAVWQWTASPYVAYPRYRPAAGALGEYNGKFMANQMVLRGGACVTPTGHERPTYRNFYPAAARWCFGGLRLADDA